MQRQLVRNGLARAALAASLATSCAVVTPAPTTQEHCPYDGAQPHAARVDCPYEVLGTFLQGISQFAHGRWDPQRTLSNPNDYVTQYGGRALTAVLSVRVNAFGKIDQLGLQRSSGVERIDGDALNVFPKGESMLYPPSCALSEGSFSFRVGLCVEVVRPSELRWDVEERPEPRAGVLIVPDRR
jgi:hypothetical protein